MKKLALFAILTVSALSLAANALSHNPTIIAGAPDIPPPDCAPVSCPSK
ncbi:MAG TPA: hypothetical protein VNX18_10390 [Bryobacteraceae bacterium]|jgi:hypothetical protein|nr:hypothetical protein [Bryobacteraceae bacterium]